MPENEKSNISQDRFTFQRMGGIDQVVMLNDYDWQHLDELDSKLWMALSCPIAGLEFSPETLALLDSDHDGRIRAQEVKEAAAWVCARLLHPARLSEGRDGICAAELRDDTAEGRDAAAALKIALKLNSRAEDEPLLLDDIEKTLAHASGYAFNGDGVITLASAAQAAKDDPDAASLPELIRTGIAVIGAKKDASGEPGLDDGLFAALRERVTAIRDWREAVKNADLPLAGKTGDAWTLLQKLEPKIRDYFNRCRLIAYAPETASSLGESALAQQMVKAEGEANLAELDPSALLSLPIARLDPDCRLDLTKNINPAWEADLKEFAQLFAPLLPKKTTLDPETWNMIWSRFAHFAAILQKKPAYDLPPADAERFAPAGLPELACAPAGDTLERAWLPPAPNQMLDSLSEEQLAWLLSDKTAAAFAKTVRLDQDAPPLASFQNLRKLSLYSAHLYTFMMNFLSFMDFYNPEKKAIFQTGTLYLDSRGCMLSVPVADIDAHARLADPSHLCLIYCECTRKGSDGAEDKMTIASALTRGNLADLLDGRHGLFIDNNGKEWDTRIVRIVHNPVSLREAVWSPYIRIANMISEQIQKFVASKQDDAVKTAATHVTEAAQAPKPGETKGGFDFAKGAGIFAALGVALSAVSAAFAYIANSLASLGWLWPFAIILIFICISGPSVFLAWLKLRRRSLGPLLDASGWAVNQGAPINFPMGASLTSVGHLPPNATLNPDDPYSLPGKLLRKKWKNRFWLTVFLLVLACVGAFALYVWLAGEPAWLIRIRALTGI